MLDQSFELELVLAVAFEGTLAREVPHTEAALVHGAAQQR
jgi:hypothetical protein